MSRRAEIRMSEAEVAAFLESQPTLIVATIGADGTPHVTPNYFAVVEGLVVFSTYQKSQKVRNLERDPRMSILVEAGDGYAQLRGVMMRGTAEIRRSPDEVVAVATEVSRRYPGPLDEVAGSLGATQLSKRAAVVFHPEHVATWDHGKLAPGTY